MLFTRCPDCDTTYRITADALRQADGQVRCGRCAHVFNAYRQLRRRVLRKSAPGQDAGAEPAAGVPAAASPGNRVPDITAGSPPRTQNLCASGNTEEIGDISFERVIAELEVSAAADDPGTKPGPAADTDASRPSGGAATFAPTWVILDDTEPHRTAKRVWLGACIGAGILLAVQLTHHARAELATLPAIGSVVQSLYAQLGGSVAPAWDLSAYEIVIDWASDAAIGPDAPQQLRIAAWVRNRGSHELPLPHVQVKLKDRWESTIGTRIFAPAEYLRPSAARTIRTGQSARVELALLDPGPDAYGFELDVCIGADAGAMRCAGHEIYR